MNNNNNTTFQIVYDWLHSYLFIHHPLTHNFLIFFFFPIFISVCLWNSEIARRFQTTESHLRQSIFRMTNGMYPELITRPDIKVFLPPIGGLTIYIWGDPQTIPDEDIELTCRVHDECNGSDVFGSDICTCRPYLTHSIEECIRTAQRGGCGVVIYYRKEGRSLGEVTKYLVYNTRKRQEGGDSAERYFSCTEQVAGVQDTRFQALMPDPLHFLGVTKIHNFISMSDMKYNVSYLSHDRCSTFTPPSHLQLTRCSSVRSFVLSCKSTIPVPLQNKILKGHYIDRNQDRQSY